MLRNIFEKIFGSKNSKVLKDLGKIVKKINELETDISPLSDSELREKTHSFKERLHAGETLDHLLPEAFAVVREASRRALGMRHFDVQLMGGIALHRGMIAEMKTGEGKTLVATLPVYLNALTGKGVHVVTVNDYLAKRDSQHMGRLYEFLGLKVSCILSSDLDSQRKKAYEADITYGTNNEIVFDFLRDNMKMHLGDMCQRPFNFAIVDEADSVFIDEARTPCIISGPAEQSSDLYGHVNRLIPKLLSEDYEKDEKNHNVTLTEKGMEHVEALAKEAGLLQGSQLFDLPNTTLVHHIQQALRAHKMYHRNKEYIVENGEVILIDEFTGRKMEGRRYSGGLHQAIEAKESVDIEVENQTLASITFQNFFKLYPKVAGMTGTAMTEVTEFKTIYNLEVVEIPTNKPVIRKDAEDEIYRSFQEKLRAVTEFVKKCHGEGQPVLVGTISIEKSEVFSQAFTKANIPHRVLNARHHQQEAQIIAQAGRPGAITIATNMAGRGTDIKLGGNLDVLLNQALDQEEDHAIRESVELKVREQFKHEEAQAREAGGLFVIGTERHESRRIDNQLRGRSGRQGDPGASKFFISLEDDLMQNFGPNIQRFDGWLKSSDWKENEAITHPWISKALERAQRKVEDRNFDVRKHLLKYDDVMNTQRKAIYQKRKELLKGNTDLASLIDDLIYSFSQRVVSFYAPAKASSRLWNTEGLEQSVTTMTGSPFPELKEFLNQPSLSSHTLQNYIEQYLYQKIKDQVDQQGEEDLILTLSFSLLKNLDQVWKDHLYALDQLRNTIHLQAYGQKDPLNEYKHEAFRMFEEAIDRWRDESLNAIYRSFKEEEEEEGHGGSLSLETLKEVEALKASLELYNQEASSEPSSQTETATPKTTSPAKEIPMTLDLFQHPRNSLCPCGSGKKFKYCHGAMNARGDTKETPEPAKNKPQGATPGLNDAPPAKKKGKSSSKSSKGKDADAPQKNEASPKKEGAKPLSDKTDKGAPSKQEGEAKKGTRPGRKNQKEPEAKAAPKKTGAKTPATPPEPQTPTKSRPEAPQGSRPSHGRKDSTRSSGPGAKPIAVHSFSKAKASQKQEAEESQSPAPSLDNEQGEDSPPKKSPGKRPRTRRKPKKPTTES